MLLDLCTNMYALTHWLEVIVGEGDIKLSRVFNSFLRGVDQLNVTRAKARDLPFSHSAHLNSSSLLKNSCK